MKRKFGLFLISLCLFSLFPWPSYAQMIVDSSLGTQINLDGSTYTISAGSLEGGNLFHSFLEFNVDTGQIANFIGPDSVENIITRVTGGNISNIRGKLQSTISNANLYLINPAGIVFGEGASLDIGGSFYVSTADFLTMGEGQQFVINQEASTLFSAAPTAFGFLDDSIGTIQITGSTLKVNSGKEIGIVGGTIEIQQSNLETSSGNLHLVSVASAGEISLNATETQVNSGVTGGEIQITDSTIKTDGSTAGGLLVWGSNIYLKNSKVQATTTGSGSGGLIKIQGRNLLLEGSSISSITTGEGVGSKIQIDVEENVTLFGEASEGNNYAESIIESKSFSTAVNGGASGEIGITASNLLLQNGAAIANNTVGTGQGGQINIVVQENVELSGSSRNGDSSSIQANTLSTESNGGSSEGILIQAKNLKLNDGSTVISTTSGTGTGGKITIQLSENLELSGKSSQGDGSWVYADSYYAGIGGGNAGLVEITAKNIIAQDGAVISTSTQGTGQGGAINIQVEESITFSGVDGKGYGGWIYADSSYIDPNGGNAGTITIQSKNLTLEDGARISSTTQGGGQGGSIDIQITEKLSISGESSGTPLAGENQERVSGIYAKSTSSATGKAGTIQIQAQDIELKEGTIIKSTTAGSAQGGTITITTDTLSLSGQDSQGYGSWIYTDSYSEGQGGAGGEILITARDVSLVEGARISSSTLGAGESGKITLQGVESLQISGGSSQGNSGIYATSDFSGTGGGKSGEIEIHADEILLEDGAQISIKSANEQAGKIAIYTNSLYLENAKITTEVQGGSGDAGNIAIQSENFIVMNGSEIIANAYQGNGGNINIKTSNLISSSNSKIQASSQFGLDGSIEIDTPDTNVSGKFLFLASSFADTTPWIQEPCSVTSNAQSNSLVVTGRDAMPNSPEDLQASSIFQFQEESQPEKILENQTAKTSFTLGCALLMTQGFY